MDKRSIFFIILMTASFFLVQKFFSPKLIPPQTQTETVHEKPAQQTQDSIASPSSSFDPSEKLYVLENDFMQLVFSNKGGSLAEINLPFLTKENKQSVVHPIEIDRSLLEEAPESDHFPLRPAYFPSSKETTKEGTLGGYYPLIRRNIIHPDGEITAIPPQYYALNVYDSRSKKEPINFKVTRFEKNLIEFQSTSSERQITKTYTLPEKPDVPYIFDVDIRVDGDSKNLWVSTGIPEVEIMSNNASPLLKYRITKKQKPLVENIKLPKTLTNVSSIRPDWVSNANGFFGLILDPLSVNRSGYRSQLIPGKVAPSRLTLLNTENNKYPAEKYPGYELSIPMPTGNSAKFRLYAGPYQISILKGVDSIFTDHATGYNPDYKQAQSHSGWFSFISVPFAKFLFFLMDLFYSITHSWGIAIILLTIALRAMLFPLNKWSIKSTMKMQEVAPKVKAIQARYKKEPKKAQIEVMKLYRAAGANPLTGCFPLLIQMPFLFGMFNLLRTSFQLRGASFIPGWIDNLTAPDVLFSWSYSIPVIGNQFHLLPILSGVIMFFQQKLSSPLPKNSTDLTDQQKQQQMMTTITPVLFAFIFYNLASGLNLYMISSTLLGIGQQWIMKRSQDKAKKSK